MGAKRIEAAFERARAEGRAALVVFVTCGDPDVETSEALIPLLFEAGADVVELGMPHSDPIGEGPTIQASSERALAHSISPTRILELAKRLRPSLGEHPLVVMGYWNNALAYGEERLAADCAAAGVDGLILADLPFDEREGLRVACEAHDVARVLLVTPTTPPERMIAVARQASGFLYCVSVTGVTGARQGLPPDLGALVARAQRLTSTPVAVGFGVSTPEQAAAVGRFADGVIVGSALVDRIGKAPSRSAAIEVATEFVRALRAALDGARR